MHITHILGHFYPECGGPANELPLHCRAQAKAGHSVSIRVLEGFPGTSPAIRLNPPIDWFAGKVQYPYKLGCSTMLMRRLRQDSSPDIYHLHGAWLRAMFYGFQEAKRRKRPYLLHLMGMYQQYALKQNWLPKVLVRHWFQDRMLRDATCLHVNSVVEVKELRELGFQNPMAVMPVGVDMEAVSRLQAQNSPDSPWPELQGKPFLLYLSRIHPKKGIELLLEAWAHLSSQYPEFRVLIAGSGDADYILACRERATNLGIASTLLWAGHVTETQRCWAYSNAACYILPTYSENFGNTVAEALAHGIPVLTTTGTPWLELKREGCGWVASPTVNSLEENLGQALATTSAERIEMGIAGRKLVNERYSLEAVVRSLDAVYRWMLDGGPKPECIQTKS
jgi:glycosyltransferase involved in cell wall biosynthesis